jgi:hypothetical protein
LHFFVAAFVRLLEMINSAGPFADFLAFAAIEEKPPMESE